MTHYRLTSDGLVPHTVDIEGYRKYFANQAAGIPQSNTIPIKEAKEEPKVEVKLVSDVQDAVDRAKAEMKHIKRNTAENISRRRIVKESTSKRSDARGKRAVKSRKKTSKKPAAAAKKRNVPKKKTAKKTIKKNVKQFASHFVHRALANDVWGPTK